MARSVASMLAAAAAVALLVVLSPLAADARAASPPSTRSTRAARFEASVRPFLRATAHSFIASLKDNADAHARHGHNEERDMLPDVARAVLTAHAQAPLALDHAYLTTLDACDDCKAEVLPLQTAFKSEASKAFFNQLAKDICIRFELFADHICNGTVDLFTNMVIEIVAHTALEPLEVCGDSGVCVVPEPPSWNVTFEREKPPVRTTPFPSPSSRRKYLLHATDLHYDPKYTPGLEADCGEPLCCRPPNPVATRRAAGLFGDFRCDAPRSLIVDMYDFIANRAGLPAVDYVLWTGDIAPHDVWESSRPSYTALMDDQAQLLVDYFPNAVVLGAVGNHESVPVDQFAPRSETQDEFSSEWLYDMLADQWSRWLPTDALTDMRRVGSYSMLLEPGLRAISLNDETCSDNNFWMRMQKETGCCKNELADPDNNLHWLVDQLQAAEDAGERVLMLRHVPNTSRCNRAWALNYHKIMLRYESTIVAMFAGHSHNDKFQLYYRDDTRTDAAVVNYVGPSATPYTDSFPGFRIYELDVDTMDIVDAYVYVANLTEANLTGRLAWYLEYSVSGLYGLQRMSAQDWDGVIDRMAAEPALFDAYYLYKHKSYLSEGDTCTGSCVTNEICALRTSYVGQPGCPPAQ